MSTLLFLLVCAVSFLFYPMSYEEFETPKAYALMTFGCISFFCVRWKNHAKDKIAVAMLLFVVSAAVSAYFSIDTHVSLWGNIKAPMGLFEVSSFFLVYLVARDVFVFEYNSIIPLIDAILGCGFLVATYALFQAFNVDFHTWSGVLKEITYVRPMSTQGHPNFMANYLAMILPFGLCRLDQSKKIRRKLLLGFVCMIYVAAIFASLSRGMIIAAFIGSFTYCFWAKKNLKSLILVLLTSVLVIITVLLAVPGFKKDALHRMDALVSPGLARKEYPKGAVRVWQLYPWLGSGTDTFELAFRNQRTKNYWVIERAGSPHRAHNDFLNILATQGILGALSAILLTAVVALHATGVKTRLGFAAVSSIIVFYVAGLTSFVVISTGTLFMISLAILKSKRRDLKHD